ncbi:MAG: 50S ribosomal protein L4 [Verrucomicrobiales bacterium]
MSAKAFSLNDAQSAKIQVIEDGSKGSQAVHDLIVAYQANRRSGTANSKTRGEVAGNTKKMYRQKGTGNARHGTSKAPIFVGGGVVFGPRPRSYAKTVNKKVRTVALRRVLGDKINAEQVVSTASFEVSDGKTKSFVAAIDALGAGCKVLVIGKTFSDETYRAGRNVAWVRLETAASVNIEQILHSDLIVLVEDSFETLAARTA